MPTSFPAPANFGGIKSGRYYIVNCHPSNATHLSNLIQSLKSVVSSAMTDTERVHPGAAYNTFFNDISYSKFVHGILGMTTTGISIDPQGSPIFWCVQGPGEIRYKVRHTGETGDMYTRCQKHPESLLQGMHGTAFIVVCPLFYTLPIADSPPAEKCLSVKYNRFKGNGWELRFFRMWLVLHELVQFYVYAMTGAETHVQDVNKATLLGGQASTRNAENYVYYVASKLEKIHHLKPGPGSQD